MHVGALRLSLFDLALHHPPHTSLGNSVLQVGFLRAFVTSIRNDVPGSPADLVRPRPRRRGHGRRENDSDGPKLQQCRRARTTGGEGRAHVGRHSAPACVPCAQPGRAEEVFSGGIGGGRSTAPEAKRRWAPSRRILHCTFGQSSLVFRPPTISL